MFSRSRRMGLVVVAIAAATVLTLAGCSSKSAGGSKASDTLNIAIGSTFASLDPALGGNGDPIVLPYELSYEPLIYKNPDGSFAPGLATKWGYTDTENKVFSLTLRKGVKFSDGGALTADGVKKSLEYYGAAKGPFASRIAQFKSIDVTGPLSLTITLTESNPELPYLLMQRSTTGDIISPKGLANPKALGTSTAGAGQYMIDKSATVTNQTYTFVQNPNYWNKSAVHYKKVVLKVITDPNATLAALKSGQIDYAFGTSRNADSAKSAGFNVYTAPYVFTQVQLFDRKGTLVKALGDQRVRQALNYAIDRKTVTKALFGSYGGPNNQSTLPGSDGYSKDLADTYAYDLNKAKSLMKEAGYANGFTLPMLAFNLQPGETDAAQAISSEWAKIGVKVKVIVPSSVNEFIAVLGKNPDMMFFYGIQPMSAMFPEWSGNGYGNPQHIDDAQLNAIYQEANSTVDTAKQAVLWQKLQARLTDLAWMVPFGYQDKIILARKSVGGIDLNPKNLDPDPIFFSSK
jgi:ABC-type transport system substrate-binding protein